MNPENSEASNTLRNTKFHPLYHWYHQHPRETTKTRDNLSEQRSKPSANDIVVPVRPIASPLPKLTIPSESGGPSRISYVYIYSRVGRSSLIGCESPSISASVCANGCPVYFFLAHNKIFIVRVDGSRGRGPSPPKSPLYLPGVMYGRGIGRN